MVGGGGRRAAAVSDHEGASGGSPGRWWVAQVRVAGVAQEPVAVTGLERAMPAQWFGEVKVAAG